MKFRVIASVFFLLSLACAQDDVHIVPRPSPPDLLPSKDHVIRKSVNLVLIPVNITTFSMIDNIRAGDPVDGLQSGHFQLFDNKKEQVIRHFSQEDAPASIGIILDRSGSMGRKLDMAKEAVKAFCRSANPADEMFLITFADTVEADEFTSITDDLQSRLLFSASKGKTSLLDAVYLGLDKMRNAKYERRALVVITDGGDNHSRYTLSEVKSVLKEADVTLYGIGLFDSQPGSDEEVEGPDMLEQLATASGGVAYLIDTPRDLEHAADTVGRLVRNVYVLGYAPTDMAQDGAYHKIKVKLRHLPKGLPCLRVFAREGYYAPVK